MKLRTLIAASALFTVLAPPAGACTTFCFERDGSVVFGKNYDFGIGYGMLVVNKRGVSKSSQVAPPTRPARWTSRYGSVTFNQFGREFPSGGMNEAGLVVELMWLDASRYPPPDSRPVVGVLEWIQYQLDSFATAAEVVANANRLALLRGRRSTISCRTLPVSARRSSSSKGSSWSIPARRFRSAR